MTGTDRIALIYGVSILGAAGLSWARGRRGFAELTREAFLHGALVGTGLNVVAWLADDHQVALTNRGQADCKPMGKVTSKGVKILSQIQPDHLYKAAKFAGMEIGPAPEDPNIVSLPQS
tara:strand:+ start:67 stop:423 length:357 start_codon:yes stop_codon:yes gene_type:complete